MQISSEPEQAVLYFTSFEGVDQNPLTILEGKKLIPSNVISFSLNNKEFRLESNGDISLDGIVLSSDQATEKTEDELMDAELSNYSLYFAKGDGIKYQMASLKNAQGVLPELIWAGDMNHDGLTDMIIELSDFYESKYLYFFLSDKDDKEKPLKKLADLKVVNDC